MDNKPEDCSERRLNRGVWRVRRESALALGRSGLAAVAPFFLAFGGDSPYSSNTLPLANAIIQVCFRLAAIATDPNVVNRIVASALDLDRKRLRLFKSGELKMSPGTINVDLDAKIAELDAAIQKLGGSMATEKQLATIGGRLGDYNTAYSILSDAAHTSPTDIQSFLKHDENRTLLGFMYGPHDKELTTFAVYAMSLQMDNLVNLDKIIKSGLPASF
jgi:hypothetical protein